MNDFQIVNSTKLFFRNDLIEQLTTLIKGKKVLLVYGGGSIKKNGCYDDVKTSVKNGNGQFHEFPNISRDKIDIEKGIKFSQENNINLIIGAGGANAMDASKIISIGHLNSNYWELINNEKNISEMEHIPLILIPTYPSSGSEYNEFAVVTDNGRFIIVSGISSNYSFLVPKYSLTLNTELTAYTSFVTIVQIGIVALGDKNPISYDLSISVIKNLLKAAQKLKTDPNDLNARGVILYGASVSASEWIGLGNKINYSPDFYFLELLVEHLSNGTYRKSLTSLFPPYLKHVAKSHENDVKSFLNDAFNISGNIDDSINKLTQLFSDFGINMFYNEKFSDEKIAQYPNKSGLNQDEIKEIINNLTK